MILVEKTITLFLKLVHIINFKIYLKHFISDFIYQYNKIETKQNAMPTDDHVRTSAAKTYQAAVSCKSRVASLTTIVV